MAPGGEVQEFAELGPQILVRLLQAVQGGGHLVHVFAALVEDGEEAAAALVPLELPLGVGHDGVELFQRIELGILGEAGDQILVRQFGTLVQGE
ncbi:Uncharacterised protein [Roseomonas gilardii subsp. rosea]|nr:Uncharacterised protein [Roseomonas gilardii subsp. rosea]